MTTRYLTSKEAAGALGVTTRTLGNWRAEEKGPPYKTRGLESNDYLYPADDLLAWAEANNVAVLDASAFEAPGDQEHQAS